MSHANFPIPFTGILSILLFISLIVFHDNNVLHGTIFEGFVQSQGQLIFLACAISATTPLLLDVVLDLFTDIFKGQRYVVYLRLLNLISLIISNIAIIIVRNFENGAVLYIHIFSWSFFIEYAVTFLLLNHWVPNIYTAPRICLCIFVVWLSICTDLWRMYFPVLDILLYSSTGIVFVTLAAVEFLFFYQVYMSYITSKLVIMKWVASLDRNIACALMLLGLQILTGTAQIIMIALDYGDYSEYSIVHAYFDQGSRVYLCIICYLVPSRITRADLIQSQKEFDVKTELVKYVSHELRTPLAVINSGLDILESSQSLNHSSIHKSSSSTTVEEREVLVDMKKSCSGAIGMLDDFLMYERIERNSVDMHMVLVRPLPFLTSAFSAHSSENVILRTDTAESDEPENSLTNSASVTDTQRICVDENKLRLVINAIVNPVLLSKHGRLEIALNSADKHGENSVSSPGRRGSASSLLLGKNKVAPMSVFRVSITVKGMKFVDLPGEKFRFERKGHDDGGYGLGFYIARRLLALQGAALETVSGEDSESFVFHIDFPVVHAASASAKTPLLSSLRPLLANKSKKYNNNNNNDALLMINESPPQVFELNDKPDLTNLRLLIVDDSSMIRKMIVKTMLSLGHTIDEACDGEAGVSAVRRAMERDCVYDVLLMDNQMPVMMGKDATRLIREQLGFTGVILGVTGNALEEDIAEFLAHGADQVVIKPLTKDNFARAVEEVYKSRDITRQRQAGGVGGEGEILSVS